MTLSKGSSAGGSPNSREGSSTRRRDFFIITGVLLVATVGYLAFKWPALVQSKPQCDDMSHGDLSGEQMGNVKEVLQNLPADYSSLVSLGNKYMDAHNYTVAAECYKRALAIEGDSLDIRVDYGACLHEMGAPLRAIEEFRRVLDINPEHIIANFNMGIVYYSLNEMDSARVYWQKCLSVDPDSRAAKAASELLKEISQ